jgi:hypothetical protein
MASGRCHENRTAPSGFGGDFDAVGSDNSFLSTRTFLASSHTFPKAESIVMALELKLYRWKADSPSKSHFRLQEQERFHSRTCPTDRPLVYCPCRLAEYDLTLDGALLEQRGSTMMMMMNNSTHEFERLLGRAALALWSDFPRDVQERLFETAVAGDVIIRNHLASYLHDHHPKTAHPAKPTQLA